MFKEGVRQVALSKSKTFLAFCFLFLISAGCSTAFDVLGPYAFYFFVGCLVGVATAFFVWHNPIHRLVVLLCIACTFGLWRGAISLPDQTDTFHIAYYANRLVTVTGFVSTEPTFAIDKAVYVVRVSHMIGSNGTAVIVRGSVLVKTKLYPVFHYGQQVTLQCRLQKPEVLEDNVFRYDKYLAKDGVYVLCSFPKQFFAITGTNNAYPWRTALGAILYFKSQVQSQLERLWTEPESSFMAGLLFGSKSGLPSDLLDSFSKTGVTHIIAVSGFNITIIATTLMTVLVAIGLWRQHAFWVVIFTLFVFVIFTGATASVVRAAYMGGLVLVAKHIGRSSRMENVLIFSAALMILVNPYLFLWDAGFQLSFLATLGLVYVSPVLQPVILSPPRRAKDPLKLNERDSSVAARLLQNDSLMGSVFETFVQTLSAIIATLPLILYQFGRLSVVAPLVNVLILWTIPWLMLGGFVSLVISFIYYPLGQMLAWSTGVGLKYVLFMVEFFGKQRWAAVEWHVPLWGMVGLYAGLVYAITKLKVKSEKLKRQLKI